MNRKAIFFVVCLFVLSSLACGLFGNDIPATPTPPQPSETRPAGPARTLPPDPLTIVLGEEYHADWAGIAFHKVPGYEITEGGEDNVYVQMMPRGSNNRTGPVIIVIRYLNETELSNQEMLDQISRTNPDITLSATRDITLDRYPGLASEMNGDLSGVRVEGRIIVAVTAPNQTVAIVAYATPARWPKLAPLVDAVAASVHFFKPIPPTETPIPPRAPTEPPPPPAVPAPTEMPTPFEFPPATEAPPPTKAPPGPPEAPPPPAEPLPPPAVPAPTEAPAPGS